MYSKENVLKDDLIKLTKDEKECYDTLIEQNEEWANAFLNHVQIGRDKITARLVSSIYRENLVQGFDHARIMGAHQMTHSPIHSGEVLTIHFTYTDQTICTQITGRHAFNRIDVQGPFYWKKGNAYERIAHPNDVLDIIIQEDKALGGEAAEQFQDDLENSAAHMIMAMSYQQLNRRSHSLIEYIESQADPYLTSEQLVTEGHPLHPGAKLRKGMTTNETIQYASEYGHPIELKFILVHQDIVRVQSVHQAYSNTVFDMFQGLLESAEQALTDKENLDDYQVMIVHPWQYHHVMHKDYSNALASRRIIPIDLTRTYYAGLSFRTLMPELPDVSPHIKLSTNVHITGEIRTLSEQTTHNGPLVSHILDDIVYQDCWFDTVAATHVSEVAGAHFYEPQADKDEQERLSEQLGTLYRKNIYHYVDQDELPFIASSLVASNIKTQTPLVIDLIQRYMQQHTDLDEIEAICQWFNTYATALIDFVVPLLVKYGIGLEAHLQNTIAVIDQNNGSLKKMLVRDFEGLRIDTAQLEKAGYTTKAFHEKSRILTDSQTSVFNKAFYSTVQNHLGELVATIVKHYVHPDLEQLLWNQVSARIKALFTVFYDSSLDPSRIKEIERVFFSETIDYKCVTTMRLLDEAHEYTYIKVQNPLQMTMQTID